MTIIVKKLSNNRVMVRNVESAEHFVGNTTVALKFIKEALEHEQIEAPQERTGSTTRKSKDSG